MRKLLENRWYRRSASASDYTVAGSGQPEQSMFFFGKRTMRYFLFSFFHDQQTVRKNKELGG